MEKLKKKDLDSDLLSLFCLVELLKNIYKSQIKRLEQGDNGNEAWSGKSIPHLNQLLKLGEFDILYWWRDIQDRTGEKSSLLYIAEEEDQLYQL